MDLLDKLPLTQTAGSTPERLAIKWFESIARMVRSFVICGLWETPHLKNKDAK